MPRPRLPFPRQRSHAHSTKHGARGYRRTTAKTEMRQEIAESGATPAGGDAEGHRQPYDLRAYRLADSVEPHTCPEGFA